MKLYLPPRSLVTLPLLPLSIRLELAPVCGGVRPRPPFFPIRGRKGEFVEPLDAPRGCGGSVSGGSSEEEVWRDMAEDSVI